MVSRTSRFQSSNTKSICTLKHPRDLPDLDLQTSVSQPPRTFTSSHPPARPSDAFHPARPYLPLPGLPRSPSSAINSRPPTPKAEIDHPSNSTHQIILCPSTTCYHTTNPFHTSYIPGYLPPLRSLSASPCSDGTGFVLEPRTLHLHATRYTGTIDRSDTPGPNLPNTS